MKALVNLFIDLQLVEVLMFSECSNIVMYELRLTMFSKRLLATLALITAHSGQLCVGLSSIPCCVHA